MNLSFKNKKVLITGGLGFIGSNLASRLVSSGAKVTLVDSLIPEYGGNLFNIAAIRSKVDVNISDVRDEHSMKYLIKNKDILFNLAGQTSHVDSMNDPFTDLDINAKSSLAILESCHRYNPEIKIVFASTRQVYGKPHYLPVDEKHPLQPVDINGVNKLAGEWYHILYNNVYGIRACVLRLTNTYGPGMRIKDARQTFLGIWIRSLLEGKAVKVFGDGMQLRDFNYVDDCVDALLCAASSDTVNGMIFNLGSKEVVNLKALAEMMLQLGYGGTVDLKPFPAERKAIDIGDYYTDFSLITQKLGWAPKVELSKGLRKTLAYYHANWQHYFDAEDFDN